MKTASRAVRGESWTAVQHAAKAAGLARLFFVALGRFSSLCLVGVARGFAFVRLDRFPLVGRLARLAGLRLDELGLGLSDDLFLLDHQGSLDRLISRSVEALRLRLCPEDIPWAVFSLLWRAQGLLIDYDQPFADMQPSGAHPMHAQPSQSAQRSIIWESVPPPRQSGLFPDNHQN